APDLNLYTLDGNEIHTKDIDADLLLLYFYDPDCFHCQTSTPEIYTQLYKKYRDKGLKVVAINTSEDKQKWVDFVNKNHMTDWLNGIDNEPNSGLWLKYNLLGTPDNYLLDKEKIIIDKRLDLQELDAKVNSYLNNK
ncbi:TlpA family protein disulfide reductase, partial [Dysgonomonas sp. OttesenSCG-928-M03]|nr:TlpA family protein disulfide reductase [Dysgonomonas sp. OttesenSCG-928-M03]